MLRSGCSALHGVNPNLKKQKNSNRFMDDIILIHNSHLGGGIENEKL